jgi:hypothetical protein
MQQAEEAEAHHRNDREKIIAFQNRVAPWQRMLSGRRLDLLDPSPLDIEIEDIAHGLARVARWNGQTHGAHIFSVAQHTLLVEAVLRSEHRASIIAFVWRRCFTMRRNT